MDFLRFIALSRWVSVATSVRGGFDIIELQTYAKQLGVICITPGRGTVHAETYETHVRVVAGGAAKQCFLHVAFTGSRS